MGEMNRDAIVESLGELRLAWDAMFRRLAELEARMRKLEDGRMDKRALSSLPDWLRAYADSGQWFCEHKGGFGPPFPLCDICAARARVLRHQETLRMIGTIDGLEGEWTITPSPRFES